MLKLFFNYKMQSFTDMSDDNIIHILDKLNNKDLLNICKTNKQISFTCQSDPILSKRIIKLKKAYQKVDLIINLFNKREYGIKLQTEKEFEPLKTFLKIMEKINIEHYSDYSNTVLNNVINDDVIYLNLDSYNNHFYITYYTSDIDDPLCRSI